MDQAEQLRNIIKMKQIKPKTMARVITVTSGKGGVGKSNVSINLGIQLKKLGLRVIILDADFGLANVEVLFGTIPKFNLKDTIEGRMSLKEIITQGPLGVQFISGGAGVEGLTNLSKVQLGNLLRGLAELDTMADVILVDTGAGISDSVLEFVAAGSEVLLITTPEPASITDSYSLLKALHHYRGFRKENTQIKMVANKVSNSLEGRNLYSKLNLVTEKFMGLSLEYLGYVPLDEQLIRSVMKQSPVSITYPNAKSVKAFEQLAMELTGTQRSSHRRSLAEIFTHYIKGSRDK
ncbi:MAG: MinD/ParA family protein [Lachnospiraceae bacterium]|nr:MinD/ParA family protein [Lachnospiraceae bacterium]